MSNTLIMKVRQVDIGKKIKQSKLTKSLSVAKPELRKQTNFVRTLRGIRKA